MRPFCATGSADAVGEAIANAVMATNRPSLSPCIEPDLRNERFDPSSGGWISPGQRTSEPQRLRLGDPFLDAPHVQPLGSRLTGAGARNACNEGRVRAPSETFLRSSAPPWNQPSSGRAD